MFFNCNFQVINSSELHPAGDSNIEIFIKNQPLIEINQNQGFVTVFPIMD